jgi:hypothetical protein
LGESVTGEKLTSSLRIFAGFYFAAVVWMVAPLSAQNGDPPGRVARLSYVSGSVSFEPSGENAWSVASLNYPVTSGDRLWTDSGARAELETGNLAIRMAEQTDLTATTLTDQLVQLGLAQGTVRIRAYELHPGNEVEVDTSAGAVTIQVPGDYRIETYPDQGRTLIIVNQGEAQVTGNGLNQVVQSGEALQLDGTNPVQANPVSLPPPDDFDRWCSERDQRYLHARSREFVNPYVPGFYDLDGYGSWETVADYGPIWYPVGLPVGWCPYRFGRWIWVEPWGWTWLDEAAWGFAPFHYGRWFLVGGRWGWIPGPIAVLPVYAPAFVAFLGGAGFSVSIGVGGVVGWFPLGPGEPFFPWYHHSDLYLRQVNITNVRNINITNITNITNINNVHYRYQTTAATAVPANAFRNAEPVHRNLVPIKPEQLARAQVVPHPSVNPTARAVSAGNPPAHPPVPPQRPATVQHAPVGQPSRRVTTAHNAPPNERTLPPAPRTNSATVPHATIPPSHPPATASAVHPALPTPSRPPLVSKYPPPRAALPFDQRVAAMAVHPGRPLEPQQVQNMYARRPAGPMLDREFPSHAPAMRAAPAPAPPRR